MLLEAGIKRADEEGAKCYLEATKEGNALYKKFGWNGVDEIVIDMVPFGGEGKERYEVLVREPKETKA